MAEVYSQYTEELSEEYGYLATWLPNVRLHLGDVGILRRDRFELITSLKNLAIPFEIRETGEAADYQYVSADGANIAFGANAAGLAGATLAASSAKASVTFKRANAVVFVAKGCKSTFIDRQDVLGKEILARDEAGSWPKNHVVITELVTADSATVIISATADAKIEFSAESKLAPSGVSLADVAAGLQVASSSGVAAQIVASRQLTPLFRASGVRRRLLGGANFQSRSATRSDSVAKAETAAFVDLGYADLE